MSFLATLAVRLHPRGSLWTIPAVDLPAPQDSIRPTTGWQRGAASDRYRLFTLATALHRTGSSICDRRAPGSGATGIRATGPARASRPNAGNAPAPAPLA